MPRLDTKERIERVSFCAASSFFEVSIVVYTVIYPVWELIGFILADFSMSTPALHLIGFAVGFGALYVKRGWVNCENWDLFAVMAGNSGRPDEESTPVGHHADTSLFFGKDVDVDTLPVPRTRKSDRPFGGDLSTVNRLIDAGRYFDASEQTFSLRIGDLADQLAEPRLRRLASGLHDGNAVDEAQMFLEVYEERFGEQADWCRVRLARILLRNRRKPDAALTRLNLVRLSQLTSDQRQRAKDLVAAAKQQIQSGVKDTDDDLDWE